MPATLTMGVQLLGCSGERYARPPGPVPRYEEAPVMAWDAGATPSATPGAPEARYPAPKAALPVPGAAPVPASDLRPPAHLVIQDVVIQDVVIQRVAERASDERHNKTNVSHD